MSKQTVRLTEQERANRFNSRFAQANRELTRLTSRGASNIAAVLRSFRTEIDERLAMFVVLPNAPFPQGVLPLIEDSIAQAVASLTQGAEAGIAQELTSAFDAGSRVTRDAFAAARVPLAAPQVTPELLTNLTALTGEILTDTFSALADQIIGRVRAGAIGLRPASATITEIEDLLRTGTIRRGVRIRIGPAFQAEQIARTEIGRVFSSAQQAASEQIAETIPGLKKKWVVTLGRRRGHRAVQESSAEDPIAISERFSVTDFSRIGRTSFITKRVGGAQFVAPTREPLTRRGRPVTDQMLHPRDPSASAGNVVNCTCITVDIAPDLEEAQQRSMGIVTEEV